MNDPPPYDKKLGIDEARYEEIKRIYLLQRELRRQSPQTQQLSRDEINWHSRSIPYGLPEEYYAILDSFLLGCKDDRLDDVKALIHSEGVLTAAEKTKALAEGLRSATWNGNGEIVRYLLDHNALVRLVQPLTVFQSRSREILQMLLDHGWDVDQQGPAHDSTLLEMICADEDFLRWCIDHGANPNLPIYQRPLPPSDNRLLDFAACRGSLATVKYVRSITTGKGNPLHYAAGSAAARPNHAFKMDIVSYLVEELGYDVNALDCETGHGGATGTPLQSALKTDRNIPCGGTEVVMFLLARGADPTIQDAFGESAIDDAIKRERWELLSLMQMSAQCTSKI